MFDYVPDVFRGQVRRRPRRRPTAGTTTRTTTAPPELLPRDEVARAINSEVKAGRGSPHGGVFLDVSTRLPAEEIQQQAAVDAPPVQGAGRRRHHRRADGGRPDLPLRDGRRRGRPRHRQSGGARAVRGRRGRRRHARLEPARRQLAVRPAGVRPAGRARRRGVRRLRSAQAPAGRARRGRRAAAERRRWRRSTLRRRREPVHDPRRAAADDERPGRHHPHARTRCEQALRRLAGAARPGGEGQRRGRPAVQPRLAPRARPAQHAARLRVRGQGGAGARGVARRPHPRRLPGDGARVAQGQPDLLAASDDGKDVGRIVQQPLPAMPRRPARAVRAGASWRSTSPTRSWPACPARQRRPTCPTRSEGA